MAFREIQIEDLTLNPFTKIGREWMLITAGTADRHNTMTAAWGGLGYLWNKNVVTAYIRPQRYTKEFVDSQELFTLSFFGTGYREALTILGRNSGRNCDKIAMSGLTPADVGGTTAFQEAELILVCRKLYHQDLQADCFDVPEIDAACYPQKDYHTMYIGEIQKILVKED